MRTLGVPRRQGEQKIEAYFFHLILFSFSFSYSSFFLSIFLVIWRRFGSPCLVLRVT
jgi:hypothetical protein